MTINVNDTERIDALLVGYESQENLGLRSILAYLRARGQHALLIPFCHDNDESVLLAIQHFAPRLVGFSLIFQYSLDEFSNLMGFLRAAGVTAHFTAGGHFPSLRPDDALGQIPYLDSIVRFEGEETLSELITHLDAPEQWKKIPGLTFRDGKEIVTTENRPLISDLDTLPLLQRDEPQSMAGGIKGAAMLSSRGCLFNCSFCSIRQFYGSSQGLLRRARSPRSVVLEMLGLHRDKGISFFSFQDDDFAARSASQRRWLMEFLEELKLQGLSSKVAWKISCRVDDLEAEILKKMQDHGLLAVYLGVESGNSAGLTTLNKGVSVEQNLAAVDLLKQHQVAMAIGFMLFDPSSTLETVRQNIQFLRSVGGDGYFAINFCKMLPYAGTPIEAQLRREGRLKGTLVQPDYNFLDPTLEWFEFLVQKIFSKRNFSPDGIVALLQRADFDWRLASYFALPGANEHYGRSLQGITQQANLAAVDALESLLEQIQACDIDFLLDEQKWLVSLFEAEWQAEMRAEVSLKKLSAGDDAAAWALFDQPAKVEGHLNAGILKTG